LVVTGRKLLFAAALIAAVAAIAALAAMEWDANRRLREQTDHSRDLLVRLTRLEVENSRLSNLVAQANTPLADEQLAELDKLRAEVRVLRGNTNDLSVMQAELHRLHAELANIRSAVGSNAPPNVPAEDIYPRDAWKFAGYDTPEHALESVTWAISEGDQASYMAALSPELQTEMQTELADGNFGDIGPLEMNNATGYRIVDRQGIGANIRTITVYMDGEGTYVPLTFQKTPNGWMVTGGN
jgi:hypothetical protein